MKILITGATGAVGNATGRYLAELGHDLIVISRSLIKAKLQTEFPATIIEHDLNSRPLEEKHFKDVEAVIHLLGETVDGRWTTEKKQKILQSRVDSSINLLQNIPPTVKTIVSASAQGIYGNSGDKDLFEEAPYGHDFLAEVCKKWEAPFVQHSKKNSQVRCVQLRIGLVLDSQSGALKKMLPLFQSALGGRLGSGQQFMSWIALSDLARLIGFSLTHSTVNGPINCCAPKPVTNTQFTKELCLALGVFESLPVPKLALKVAVGEMADVVMGSIKMNPQKIINLGFSFEFNHLRDFFKAELSQWQNGFSVFIQSTFIEKELEEVKQILSEKNKNAQTFNTELALFKERFQVWNHSLNFQKLGSGTLVTDHVNYKPKFGFVGQLINAALVQSQVQKLFSKRREEI